MKRPWLAPLNPLYAAGVALRNWRVESGREAVKRLRWPVVSVGSLSAGGAGKTPTTIALAKALVAEGFAVDVLSRGYGRKSRAAARVLVDGTAEEFGDEPLLIARAAGVPVYVAAQRYEAGLLAEAELPAENGSPCVHLLDDGFQHRQLYRDVDVLLLSSGDMTDSLLPAGNLREPLQNSRRATVIAIPSDEPEVEDYLREIVRVDRGTELPRWVEPMWRIRRSMSAPEVTGRVAAFCGIAWPGQFFGGLEKAGLTVGARIAFPDHHGYTQRDFERILAAARAAGAIALVTTEKDLARLGAAAGDLRRELPLLTAGLSVEIDDAAIRWLVERLHNIDSVS